MKQFYKKTKTKLQDRLRPPQSVSTSPAQSHRNSEELTSTQGRGTSSVSLTQVQPDRSAIAPAASVTPGSHVQGASVLDPRLAPHTTAEYAKSPSPHSKLSTAGSVSNDLLTIAHASSDAFPPLKSVLGGILEIWKQCEVSKICTSHSYL